ncbi:MAG: hypothetical protein K2X81_17190, partial [Candidatus Obscuribacterales bacterium]|nr:hypothetical protein [Candidatus Obscuribacterales bacterium]
QSLNNLLEKKVMERTHELMESNARLLIARDEAILANKLKSQFVANISHEIRTPMSGILSATELVLDDPSSINDESSILIQMAHESAKNLMLILNDILDFAKLESGKSELKESQFCLAAVIGEALETVSASAKKKSLPINEDVPELLKTQLLTGDAILMKRVLVNLVHNAVKFTHEGEVNISVDSKVQNEDTILIRTEVVDTGIGIADSDMAKLFQPFVQADGSNTRIYGGTGLGLSICSGYVRLMGGVMGVESTKNKGSKFWFEVPLKVASNE